MKAGEPEKGTVPRPRRTTLGLWFVVSIAPFGVLYSKGSLLSLRVCVCVCACTRAHTHACTQTYVRPSVCVTVCSERHLWDTQGLREMDQKGSGQVVTEEELGWIKKRDRMRLEGEELERIGWR